MAKICRICKGRGYTSAADNLPKDTPSILKPIGISICWSCGGAGKKFELKDDPVVAKAVEKVLDNFEKERNKNKKEE